VRPRAKAFTLVLFSGLIGCYTPDIPKVEEDWNEPRHSSADLKAHGDEAGEVLLADLAGAYGLEVKIDKVTGRRLLENSRNKVVVPPGERFVVINGVQCPLEGEVRWRSGQIFLPGDARVLFGERILREPVQSVEQFGDLDAIDPATYLLPIFPKKATASAERSAPSTVRFDPHAPALPASWNQKATREWRWIVIHHSATDVGGAASFGRAHQKKWVNGLGYDFVIGNGSETADGEIEVGPRWLRQREGIDGAHAGVEKYNKHGIGICLVGDFDERQPSPKQMAALRNLTRHLMERYGISKQNILPHREVKVGHTECPGKAFPFDAFIRSL
jgi:hypothetical protein